MNKLGRTFLLVIFLCLYSCSPKSDLFKGNLLNIETDSLDITSVWENLAPLQANFPVQISESDKSYYLFVPYWGDFYKISNDGELLFSLEFNTKEILSKNPLKFNIQGATFGFEIFDDKLYFLDSKSLILCYSKEGILSKKYSLLNLVGSSINFKILDDNTVIVLTYQLEAGKKVFRFVKYNLESHETSEIFSIERLNIYENYFVKFIDNHIVFLGSYEDVAEVYSISGKKISNINIPRNSKRRYDNQFISKDIDYFSLTVSEKINFANDMTVDFSHFQRKPMAIQTIYNRVDTTSIKMTKLFTYVDTSDNLRELVLKEDALFSFDDFGNLIYLKSFGEKKFIYKSTPEKGLELFQSKEFHELMFR